MGSTDNSAIMTIDLKWNRFRIHKSTLNKMGNPQYVQFLVNPEEMLVAYNRKCKYTLRMTKLHSGKVAAEDDFVEENEEPLADDPVLEE